MSTRRWWQSEKQGEMVREITKDIALEMLETVKEVNRDVNQKHVQALAQQMLLGRWLTPSEQSSFIDFDTRGRCIDGQHRLWAVVESGCRVAMRIMVGSSDQKIHTYAKARSRSASDQFLINSRIAGAPLTKSEATLAAAIAGRLVEPNGVSNGTLQDREDAYQQNQEAIHYVITKARSVGSKTRGIRAAPFLTNLVRMFHYSPTEVDQVIDIMASGIPRDRKGDFTLIRLRNYMINRGADSASKGKELYWKANRALKAYVDDQSLDNLYAASKEHFPIESDKKIKKPGPSLARPGRYRKITQAVVID